MQDLVTVTLTLAGLFFSLVCALLLEELLFGLFFRLFAAETARQSCNAGVPPAKQISSSVWPARRRPYQSKPGVPEGGVVCSH